MNIAPGINSFRTMLSIQTSRRFGQDQVKMKSSLMADSWNIHTYGVLLK